MSARRRFLALVILSLAIPSLGLLVACQAPPPVQPLPVASSTAVAEQPVAMPTTTQVAISAATATPLATPLPNGPTPAPIATPVPTGPSYGGSLASSQVLRLDLGMDPPTLDPSRADDTGSVGVLTTMYEGLTRFRPDLSVEPAIAKSWEISPDGKTYTFKLRDSKFSDGTAVTAKDFEFAWKRLIDPRINSGYAFILTDEIVGAAEFNAAAITDTIRLPLLEAAVGVKAVDNGTFRVTLKNPATHFLALTALWNTVPLSKAAIDRGKEKWTDAPNHISNGPFVLKQWRRDLQIVLEPNLHYWDTKPTLTRIELSMRPDEKAQEEAYKNNEVDVARVPLADVPGLRSDPILGNEILQSPMLGTYFLGFNAAKEPFAGQRGKLVRQAFSQAIDRQKLVDAAGKGVTLPARSFLPPGLTGHRPDIGFDFDPARARATLTKAGFENGAALGKITLAYNSPPVPGHKAAMELVADQLSANLGVEVELKSYEWGAYLDQIKHDPPQMFRLGWNADYPHPNAFLNMVFHSRSAQNFTMYNNADFDRLVTEAAREGNLDRQMALYDQAQRLLVEDAPAVFLYHYGRLRLVKPWVKDLIATAQDGELPGAYFYRFTKIAAR